MSDASAGVIAGPLQRCISLRFVVVIVQVYKMYQPHHGYGALELVEVFDGIKDLPKWENLATQVYHFESTPVCFCHSRTNILHLQDREELYLFSRITASTISTG